MTGFSSVATTAAWIAHDIGLATNFGGALFGKLALKPAVKLISSGSEQGKVEDAAWYDFSILNSVALGTALVTWITGRTLISGRSMGRDARGLVLAKDVLLGVTALTGLLNIGGELMLHKKLLSAGNNGQGEVGGRDPKNPNDLQGQERLKKAFNALGTVNLLASAGVIALTAVLGMKAGRSPAWKLISRILP